jgi:superfamily II DNA helicase RecQ
MTDLLTLLRSALGDPDARFREGQEEAIRAVLDGWDASVG